MVTRYGMVPELGPVAFETERPGFLGQNAGFGRPLYGAEIADRIDRAMTQLVEAAYQRAKSILDTCRAALDAPFSLTSGRYIAPA
jgi:cell division protease FtsH